MWGCVYVSSDAFGGVRFSEAEVTGGCEPANVGTGYQTLVLCKNSTCS